MRNVEKKKAKTLAEFRAFLEAKGYIEDPLAGDSCRYFKPGCESISVRFRHEHFTNSLHIWLEQQTFSPRVIQSWYVELGETPMAKSATFQNILHKAFVAERTQHWYDKTRA